MVIAKTWKQPKCTSTDEWRKMYISTMEDYLALEKSEIMPTAATRMDLEIVILSEVSQRQIYHLYVEFKKWYKWTYLQNRNWLTNLESSLMVGLAAKSCPILVTPTAGLRCPWDSPGRNTGVGCHFLLQGIFPMQESNPGLLNCRQILYRLSCKGSPNLMITKGER